MAYKNATAVIAATWTTVYTAPTNTTARVISAISTEVSGVGGGGNYDVRVVDVSATPDTEAMVADNIPIGDDAPIGGIVLEAGDHIDMIATRASAMRVTLGLETDGDLTLVEVIQAQMPAIGTAGNDGEIVVGAAPIAGSVSAVGYIADAALSGANTNSRTISALNRGAAGAGTTEFASLALVTGTDLVKWDEKDLTLSVTPADLVVAVGDVITFKSLHVLTGIVDPGGLARVTITSP